MPTSSSSLILLSLIPHTKCIPQLSQLSALGSLGEENRTQAGSAAHQIEPICDYGLQYYGRVG